MRSRSWLLLLSLPALTALLGVSPDALRGQTARHTATASRLNEVLESIRKKHDVPALCGAIVTSKGLCAIGATGVRKRGASVRVTADDQFHLGSDTKALTATMIARLVEDGKLRYSTTLAQAFPELADSMAPEVGKITLLQLLTHRSGLPPNLKGGWAKVAGKDSLRQQRLAAVRLSVSEKLRDHPGEKYRYSNLGYVMAAAMAEKAANASWEDLMAREVFRPLRMSTAGFGPAGSPDKVDEPWPHRADGSPVTPGPDADNPSVMAPAGGVHCSVPDWASFLCDQLRGARGQRRLLRVETYKVLQESPFRDPAYTPGGWLGLPARDGTMILTHDGSNTYNYAAAFVIPARDLALLVATNEGAPGGAGEKATHEAIEALLHFYVDRP